MDTRSKRSTLNFITSLIGTLVGMVLGLIVPRLVLTNYGSETNGMINSINQFVTYLGLFEAGIGSAALQALYKPVAEKDRKGTNAIVTALHYDYRRVGTYYLLTLIGLSLVYPALIIRTGSELRFLDVALCVFFSGFGNVILFFAQGKYRILLTAEGKSYILTNLQTIISVLISIAKIILLQMGFNIVYVIISTFSFNLIQVFYIIWLIKKDYSWIQIMSKNEKKHYVIKQKRYVFIHQVAGLIFQNTDVIILTVVCGLKTVSIYAMYKLIVSSVEKMMRIPLDSTSFAFGQIYNTDTEKRTSYAAVLDCFEVYYSTIYFAVYAAVFCFILPFLSIYTAGVNDINYLNPVLPYLFIAVELLTFMRMLGLNTITYAGKFKDTTPQTIIETIINITISIIGVLKLGIYGVLIGTIVALGYRFVDVIIYTNRNLLKRSPAKSFCIYASNLFLFVAYVSCYRLFSISVDNYLVFFAAAAVFCIVFLIIGLIINSILFSNERRKVLEFASEKVRNWRVK